MEYTDEQILGLALRCLNGHASKEDLHTLQVLSHPVNALDLSRLSIATQKLMAARALENIPVKG